MLNRPLFVVLPLAAMLAAMSWTRISIATAPHVEDTAMTTSAPGASREEQARWNYGLQAPEGYLRARRHEVTVDGEPAVLTRYERQDGRNRGLLGEHVSILTTSTGQLKGFTRMELAYRGGALPERNRAREVAVAFLERHAPELIPNMRISWIEPHDETIRITQADRTDEAVVTGMKVKCRNTADGHWLWVIVAADESIMTFERDIVWVNFPGRRQTEKWLHDNWLSERGLRF